MEFDFMKEEDDGTVIQVEDLSVWTPEEKSWWRKKITKPSVRILNKISGRIKRGEFVAVIGPSGAGKTTFLVCIANKCRLPMSGSVAVGGRDLAREQATVEIVPQFEVFMPGVTVMEHLVFMMELKLGSCKTKENKATLSVLLEEMQLKKIAYTDVNDLSGGERRLLSLATSLLSSPEILICDEPTTGLDSYNASLVIDILKKLTICGKVVICSVHQPSMDLFKEFNSLILMAEGRILFHGSHNDCKDLFERLDLRCPKNYNPAEFYIRAVSQLNFSDNVWKIQEYQRSLNAGRANFVNTTKAVKMYRRNWFKQVHLLLWRSSLTVKNNVRGQLIQLLINVVITSVVIGTCYVGISGINQRGVQDIGGLLWLMTSEVCFSLSYSALYAFESELPLFKREVGTYSCSAYFVSRLLSYIPRCIIWPMVLVFVMTLAVQLPNHVLTATLFFIILSFTSVTASCYGLGMAALFTSSGVMGDVMPCADLPLFLVSGVFMRISSLPLWLYPLKYISHFYYAMDAVSNVYWRQIGDIDCPSNATTTCVKDGTSVLLEAGYSKEFVLQDSTGLLFVIVFWSLFAYYGLKREERKGYAY